MTSLLRVGLGLVGLVGLVACGGAPANTPPSPRPAATVTSASPPRSLDEALVAQGLTKVELSTVADDTTNAMGLPPKFVGNRVTMNVNGGWNAQSPVFARRADGAIVLVEPHANVIVDRHVQGGCRGFFGGRMWSRTVTFELPAGASWGPTTKVTWDQHTEVIDYTDHPAGGGPCPPPAID